MLTLDGCRQRLQRLLAAMESRGLELVVLGNPKTIYYFSGAQVDADRPQAFAILRNGTTLLVTNREPAQSIADAVELYTAYTLDRAFLRRTMNEEATAAVKKFAVRRRGSLAAVEFEFLNTGIGCAIDSRDLRNITPLLEEMRRRKDPDELEEFQAVIGMAEAAYGAIRSALRPGMTEYEAYLVMYEAMVRNAGTALEFRGDFAAGVRGINGGGPPTDRKLEEGDLYILDLFPSWQGYTCDLCRTFCVGEATGLQRAAWECVVQAHEKAREVMRPGARCRDLYAAIRDHLETFEAARGSFSHHLGHGVGMDAWEYPWLNRGTDQELLEGEVIAVEPGLYSEDMRGGVRLEHNYLVGAGDVRALDSFPLDL
jgi:Xaa-Pro aminopeptidase